MLVSRTEDPRTVEGQAPQPVADKQNRRIQRIALPLPIRVEVRVDKKVNWCEITRLSDVSAFGAGFTLKRPIKRGRVILLTLPMPRQLRSFDYSEPQYRIWAIVRRCIAGGLSTLEPEYAIGVGFIGKTPPHDFIENPSRLYDIAHREDVSGFWHIQPADLMADESDLPKEVRKQTRYVIPESLTVEQVDEAGNVVRSEVTVTENISFGGAAVFSTLNAAAGTFVRVKNHQQNIEILSIVRGSRPGPDGVTRLHLEFIDRFYPLEGLE